MMDKKYIAPLSSLITTGVLLAVALLLLLGSSLAWLSSVTEVTAGGMRLSAHGVPKTEEYLEIGGVRVGDTAEALFSGLTPGDTVSVSLVIENQSDKAILADVMLAPPTADDDPEYEEGGQYHYLGTQLRVRSVKQGERELLALADIERYLLTLPAELYRGGNDPLPPTALAEPYSFSSLDHKALATAVEVAAGGKVTLEIVFEFVDNGLLQNAYIGYGDPASPNAEKAALRFSRTLTCVYSYQ